MKPELPEYILNSNYNSGWENLNNPARKYTMLQKVNISLAGKGLLTACFIQNGGGGLEVT